VGNATAEDGQGNRSWLEILGLFSVEVSFGSRITDTPLRLTTCTTNLLEGQMCGGFAEEPRLLQFLRAVNEPLPSLFPLFFPYPKRQLYLPLGTQNPTHQSYWVFCCCFISSSYLLRFLCETFFSHINY